MAAAGLRLARDDGACDHELTGANGTAHAVVACSTGTLYWPATRTLVVADLHLEKASAFAKRGMLLPPYDTAATLKALGEAVAAWNPKRVISLGDSFHDADGAQRLTLPAREALRAMQGGREWIWITGNHDPEPPAGLAGDVLDEMEVDGLTFRHEPSVGAERGEIAGHLHPRARIVVQGKAIRRACFACDGRRMILPAFGTFTGGLSVFHRAFEGLFDGRRFQALMIGDGKVFQVPASRLG